MDREPFDVLNELLGKFVRFSERKFNTTGIHNLF